MRFAVAIAMVLSLTLAGCGSPSEPPTPSPGTTSFPTPPLPSLPPEPILMLADFSFEDCQGATAQARLDADFVQSLLPEPFIVFRTQNEALVDVLLLQCGALVTPNARVNDTWFGIISTGVQEPDLPGATYKGNTNFAWRVLSGNDVLNDLWEAAGMNHVSGAWTSQVQGPSDALSRSLTTLAGYRIEAVTSTAIYSGGGAHAGMWWMEHRDGGWLTWERLLEFGGHGTGDGLLTIPTSDPLSQSALPTGSITIDVTRVNGAISDQLLVWYPS